MTDMFYHDGMCELKHSSLFILKVSGTTDTKYYFSRTKYLLFVPMKQVEVSWHIDESVAYLTTIKPCHCKLDGKHFETHEKSDVSCSQIPAILNASKKNISVICLTGCHSIPLSLKSLLHY